MTRRPFALTLLALVAACSIAGPTAAAAPSEKTFRKNVVAVCQRGNAAVQQEIVRFANAHPDLAPEAGRDRSERTLRASLLETIASKRSEANRRLTRVTAPKRLRSRYTRFVRQERRTNVTSPRTIARLLRAPASAANDTALRAAARKNGKASAAFQKSAERLSLTRCAG